MTEQQIRWIILGLVGDRGHVSFVELLNELPEERGEFTMHLPGYESIVLWTGMSEMLARLVSEMIAEKQVHPHPASHLTYMIDGAVPQMDVAKSLRQYKEPRWFPVTLHHSPYKENK